MFRISDPWTEPSIGNDLKRLLTVWESTCEGGRGLTCKRENACHVQNDQVFCFPDEWSRKKRRGAWNVKSPHNEAMRLNSGVNAF